MQEEEEKPKIEQPLKIEQPSKIEEPSKIDEPIQKSKEIEQPKPKIKEPNYKLLFSTSTFIFPIIYAFQKGNIVLYTATCIALLGSINYWRDPKPGYRRTIDLITSNISLVAYFYYGYTNVIDLYARLLGYASLGLIAYLYNNSCTKFYLQDNTWEYYHFAFHIITSISKLYVIYFS